MTTGLYVVVKAIGFSEITLRKVADSEGRRQTESARVSLFKKQGKKIL